MISVKSVLHKRLNSYTGPSYRAPVNRKLFKLLTDGPYGKPGTYAGQFSAQDPLYILLYKFNYSLFFSTKFKDEDWTAKLKEWKQVNETGGLDRVTLQEQQLLASLSASLWGWES